MHKRLSRFGNRSSDNRAFIDIISKTPIKEPISSISSHPGQLHTPAHSTPPFAESTPRHRSEPRANLLLVLKRRLLLAVLLLTLRDGRLLVLLVLRDKIVHVGLGLGELHLVHALASVPMQEGLATEHGGELVADALEKLLDGGAVADEGGRHLQAARRDGAERRLDVVGDPLDEVGRVLVLDVAHLVLDLLHRDFATEDGGAGEVAAVAEIGGGHHVLGVEHLLGQLRNGDGTEGVRATAGERSEADHEEVETRERNHVDGQLAEIGVELARETQAGGDAGHDSGDEMVQVAIGGVVKLERPHANVV